MILDTGIEEGPSTTMFAPQDVSKVFMEKKEDAAYDMAWYSSAIALQDVLFIQRTWLRTMKRRRKKELRARRREAIMEKRAQLHRQRSRRRAQRGLRALDSTCHV